MRWTVVAALALSVTAAAAEDSPDCKGFVAKHKAMSEAVDARAPGVETDRLREKAEDYLRGCVEDDNRLIAEQPCRIIDGLQVCR